jgi:NRAMP (natural resistance-associated macrophage protein)-like metal ion transporter
MNVLKKWRARIVLLLAVIGPGFITANVDNDAGGIFTYSQAGAQFGYSLLWTMIPITIALIVVQEMASRMGAVTGKGLSDLIREEFGFRVTFWLMLALVATNFGNVVAEFAGVASSLELFGWSKYIVVPVSAAIVWALVVRGTYDSIEKVFLAASGFYVCYIVAGLLAHPDWKTAALATFSRPSSDGIRNYGYLFMVIALVGTTIAPWMQFYLQSSVVEKEARISDYRRVRLDVVLGSVVAVLVAFFIVVACAATLHKAGITEIVSGADAAKALAPLAGALYLFSEWMFFVTKPSATAGLEARQQLLVLLGGVLPLWLPLVAVQVVASLISIVAYPRLRAVACGPASVVLGFMLLMLLDNFTYTIFGFGIIRAGEAMGLFYAAALPVLIVTAWRELVSWSAHATRLVTAAPIALVVTVLVTGAPVVVREAAPSPAAPPPAVGKLQRRPLPRTTRPASRCSRIPSSSYLRP